MVNVVQRLMLVYLFQRRAPAELRDILCARGIYHGCTRSQHNSASQLMRRLRNRGFVVIEHPPGRNQNLYSLTPAGVQAAQDYSAHLVKLDAARRAVDRALGILAEKSSHAVVTPAPCPSRGRTPFGRVDSTAPPCTMPGACTTWNEKGVRDEASRLTSKGKFPPRLVGRAVTLKNFLTIRRRPFEDRMPRMSGRLAHTKYSVRWRSGTARRQNPMPTTCHPKKSNPKATAPMRAASAHARIICVISTCCAQNQYPRRMAGPNVRIWRKVRLPVLASGETGRRAKSFPSYLNAWASSSVLSLSPLADTSI